MSAEGKKPFITLDPRTKLLLVLAEAVFVLAVAGGDRLDLFRLVFAVLPFLLLLSGRRYRTFVIGILLFAVTELFKYFVFPRTHGLPAVLMMILILFISRFLPAYLMGAYVIRTTRVSEFKAAMERMHVPD